MSSKPQVTFFSKNPIACPSCNTEFNKEELQTGRGRINAGELTLELRRLYIPTQKYGVVNPLIYPILVCPSCLFSGVLNDFLKFPSENINLIQEDEENRHQIINKLFGKPLDFTQYRDTIEGAASYILAFISTSYFPAIFSPTARRGLYALRAAWLIDDLYQQSSLSHFKELRDSLYLQSYKNYELCLDRQIKNIEPFDGFIWMGPDVDTNFGYDGLLYLTSMLSLKHIDSYQPEEQIQKLASTKRILSKIFGIGKSNKNKPKVLVDNAKILYEQASEYLKKLENQGIDISMAKEIEEQENE